MDELFVIRLESGQYFADRLQNTPISSPRIEDAETFATRTQALLECGRGPASFFSRASIVEKRPQDAPAAVEGSNPPPQAQDEQGGAIAAQAEDEYERIQNRWKN